MQQYDRRAARPCAAVALAAAMLLIALAAPSAWLGRATVARAQPAAPVRILPLGDSITQGEAGHESYRAGLWRRLGDAGYRVDFLGSMSTLYCQAAQPGDIDRHHEGHWGWRVDEIVGGRGDDSCTGSGGLALWLQRYTPDIALVHLGTNDMVQGQSVATTRQELAQVISVLRADNPRVTVLLAQLIPASDPAIGRRIEQLNGAIAALAADTTQPGSPVIVVDQSSGFDSAADLYDGYHPNAAGEAKLAQRWFDALRRVLAPPASPTAPAATSAPTALTSASPRGYLPLVLRAR